ncbi:MAG: ParB/RepB/Spo0J family partition protein [Rubellimicrobium sp.]|nr:ParB/RepB/Spo0J family partition protein [Rubellimicrobium sp.]
MARKPKLGLPLQTLRNAPDALEGRRLRGGVFEIDPAQIETEGRLDDRLHLEVAGLRASIEANGQRVPILLRPLDRDRYSLIYGRRRLEACRDLGIKVRAIVTEAESDQTLRDQLLENQERRDLSFIERALVAAALLEGDHLLEAERSNRGVAEVLNLTEAGVSQLLNVVRTVGEEVILAIGAAPGIGRPRWEELKKALAAGDVPRADLVRVAAREMAEESAEPDARSDRAFLAVLAAARRATLPAGPAQDRGQDRKQDPGQRIEGVGSARIRTALRGRQFRLELTAEDKDFVDWLEGHAPRLIAELHERWKRSEG